MAHHLIIEHKIMNLVELNKVIERIKRISRSISNQEGEGAVWAIKQSDGSETRFGIDKVKSHLEIEDNVTNAYLWFWNIKDYFKEFLITKGKPKSFIEDMVNKDFRLKVCADIANRLKHGELKESRSKRYPKLGRLSYTIEVTNINEFRITTNSPRLGDLQAQVFSFNLTPEDPQIVQVTIPILDMDGVVLGDAIEYINYAVSKWEFIYSNYVNGE